MWLTFGNERKNAHFSCLRKRRRTRRTFENQQTNRQQGQHAELTLQQLEKHKQPEKQQRKYCVLLKDRLHYKNAAKRHKGSKKTAGKTTGSIQNSNSSMPQNAHLLESLPYDEVSASGHYEWCDCNCEEGVTELFDKKCSRNSTFDIERRHTVAATIAPSSNTTSTTTSNNIISYNNNIRLDARKCRLRKRRKRKLSLINHYVLMLLQHYRQNLSHNRETIMMKSGDSIYKSSGTCLSDSRYLESLNQPQTQTTTQSSNCLNVYQQTQQQPHHHDRYEQYEQFQQPEQEQLEYVEIANKKSNTAICGPPAEGALGFLTTTKTLKSLQLLVSTLLALILCSAPFGQFLTGSFHCVLRAFNTIRDSCTATILSLPISSFIIAQLKPLCSSCYQSEEQYENHHQQHTFSGFAGYHSVGSRKWNLNELFSNLWIFLLIYLNLTAKVCLAGYHEKRLLHDLLDPYNTLERPVLNESDPLQLSFGLTLMQIIDVDEKNQLLVTNVWLKLEWNDMNLRWNTSDYGGIKDLRIPPHRIWKPDVLMYNSADEGFDGTYQTNVVVRNNGSCLYVPPGIFKSTCKIDITWFPFDDQRCEMKFGSWTYDGFQLDLQLQDETGGDISSYVLNGEWELLGVPGKRNEIYYNCCPEPYIDITFAIIIRRRTLYYFFNLIIPCVLIASMALLGFTLPPDSGEKLSLGVTILLSLTVFLNMVAETMPATSDAVPLLGTYFNCIMFMVASSVVSTILILNYHHRNADTHEMSEWIRIVFLCWLPWILRMSRPGRPLILEFPQTPCSDTSSERKHQILSEVELKERSSKSLLANVLDIDDDFRHACRPMTPGGTLPHNPAFYRTVYGQGDDGSIGPIGSTRMPDAVTHHTCLKSSTDYELSLILKEIRFITDQLRKEDEENDIANDWKFAAMVVDRLCLIIFTMFTILATIAVLLSAPHIIVS